MRASGAAVPPEGGEKSEKPFVLLLGSAVGRARGEQSLDVFGQDVELEIYEIARFEIAQVGVFQGVGNDPDTETVRGDFGHGEADTVDGDRSFVGNVAGKIRRQCDVDAEVGAFFLDGQDLGRAVDMSLHEVAAQPPFDPQGSLEIDRCAGFQTTEVGPLEALLEQVEHALVVALGGDGQATTIHGHAFADADAAGGAGPFDQQLNGLPAAPEPDNLAYFANQTGKHAWQVGNWADRKEVQTEKMRSLSHLFGLARSRQPPIILGLTRTHAMKISLNLTSIALVVTCSAALLTSGCASAGKPSASAKPKTVAVTATAYSCGAKCNGRWAKRNAIGGRLQSGAVNSAAADWSRFPVGTKFRVAETGKVYIVDDYGSAMVGKDKVDLFHTSYRDVYRWGVRQVNLEIIEWGCPDKSLQILKPRTRAPHVRRMVQALQSQQQEAG